MSLDLDLLDLRYIARKGRVCSMISVVTLEGRVPWIYCGPISIGLGGRMRRTVSARLLKGATDREHDSGYAFSFDTVGLDYEESYHDGHMLFRGLIAPRAYSSFHIPPVGYDPLTDMERCDVCENEHPIVPYLPYDVDNRELYRRLQGLEVVIETGLLPEDMPGAGDIEHAEKHKSEDLIQDVINIGIRCATMEESRDRLLEDLRTAREVAEQLLMGSYPEESLPWQKS